MRATLYLCVSAINPNGSLSDTSGSFYANPTYDTPTYDLEMIEKYPEYCHSNMWPQEMPELRESFRRLGQQMVQIGSLIARECDRFLRDRVENYQENFLGNMVQNTRSHKGRLLHYFPKNESAAADTSEDSWCGWHLVRSHQCNHVYCF